MFVQVFWWDDIDERLVAAHKKVVLWNSVHA